MTSEARLKILVVDDQRNNLFTMQRLLAGVDAEVIACQSGNEALVATLHHTFAVALLDVQMPLMDGYELAELLHQNHATCHLPIIFVTANYRDDVDRIRGYQAGAVDYLMKPLEDTLLRSKVTIFLDLARQHRELDASRLALQEEIARRARVELSLKQYRDKLEEIVAERTAQLETTNARLKQEIARHMEAQSQLLLFRELVDRAMDALFVIDGGSGLVTDCNQSACRTLGLQRDDLIGQPYARFLESVDGTPRIDGMIADVKRQRSLLAEGTYSTRDGQSIPVEIGSSLVQLPGSESIVCFARDIRARKLAEAALRDAREHSDYIINAAPIPIVGMTETGVITFVNGSFCRSFGLDGDAYLGASFWDLMTPGELAHQQQRFIANLDACGLTNDELTLRDRDGHHHILMVSTLINPSVTPDRETREFVVFGVDVTEARQLEDQLRQAQRMETIGQLAGGVAHDFNNLLTVISGYSEMLLASADANGLNRDRLTEVCRAADRAAALTRQLLAFSRKQVMQPKVLDPNTVIRQMESMLRRLIGENIDLVINLDDEIERVHFDPGQLEQIIMNLVVNARDAMPKGGEVVLETTNVTLDADFTRNRDGVKPGRHVMIVVSDTGTGIAPEIITKIFEPFFTTKDKDKGTGLGLSTVYGIIKQSSGDIVVLSEPGFGTTFKICIPVADLVAEPEPAPVRKQPPRDGTGTILIVEDEPGVRDLFHLVLSSHGYTVLAPTDSQAALQLCDDYAGPIDLMLSDVVMPNMSGPDLARLLTEKRPNMCIVFMSGYTESAIKQHGALAPGTAFIEKPITPPVLLQKIRDFLGSPAPQATAPSGKLPARHTG